MLPIIFASLVFVCVANASCQPSRPPLKQRRFVSSALETFIQQTVTSINDPELACLFANTLPNTLDTTVFLTTAAGAPNGAHEDTYVVTGDINAMWLRDSMNQVLPYLRLAKTDATLRRLVAGVVWRQAFYVATDAYANAFMLNDASTSPNTDDHTSRPSYLGTSTSGYGPYIFERKYELDSLCAFFKLSSAYYNATGDATIFDADWIDAVAAALDAMFAFQSGTGSYTGSYTFQRCSSCEPTDTLSHGTGFPAAYTGMIRSMFRPSDDATLFSFNIPSNAMAAVQLEAVAVILTLVGQSSLASNATLLAASIRAAIQAHGIISHPIAGRVYAYEVDGFGNSVFMDDANVPSLLSLPYLGFVDKNDGLYLATRAALLNSTTNPWYFSGPAGSGIGGPHVGIGYIWPMSIMMQALTSSNESEVASCLALLKLSAANTGFMHESFSQNDWGSYTRAWFAWANSLFAETVLQVGEAFPTLIY